jgi:LacI family transcriptional regulator
LASVTIIHVAKHAGVSITTVSRVLNGEKYVRAELKERVLQAVRELNYQPQVTARSLAGRRSYVVGMLLTIVSPYAVQAQRGALAACQSHGYHLMIETIGLGATGAVEALVRAFPTDGMLLLPPLCDDVALLGALEAHGVPYVRVSPARNPRRGITVTVDDEGAARAMTDHLLDLGHRRIGFVSGIPDHSAARQRLKGYRGAFAARGLAPPEDLVVPGGFDYVSGYEAAERLLALAAPPTAIFASNDLDAAGVMARAHERGLQLPRDLSVAGFDDDILAHMLWPPLTTMHQPIDEMAAAATELLIAMASATSPAAKLPRFQCELVVRNSTAKPRRARGP